MKKEYDPKAVEQGLYRHWEQSGYFAPAKNGEPYCILIPPPNITGSLHMGHAFEHTLIDSLIRYHRMQGYSTLWQMGTDHAGIATQMVVERQLETEGLQRKDIGHDSFIDRVWQWQRTSGDEICQQLRRMGSSVDWQDTRFTMDTPYQAAVLEAFVRLYRQNLIYRGQKLVNWDPVLQTAISDLEVENHEEQGQLWYLRYPIAEGKTTRDGKEYLVVATTRPETMPGDVAVAVHPQDERYQHLVGHQVTLPIVGRRLPVIADDYVDPAFGTGCLKITPGHDFNDYEVGIRHGLEVIDVMNEKAEMNDRVPGHLRGLDRFEARKKIVAELEEIRLLEKIVPHKLMIPKGDRSGAVIEPRLTWQWFVAMKNLAGPAIAAVREGRVQFTPKNYENTYFVWLENIQDWCISRQQWWGHRIPAWHDEQGGIYVGQDEQAVRQHYELAEAIQLHQEEDVLETWFSSGLWSFASLGWPQSSHKTKRYSPSNLLVIGHDIIFFWAARMIMLSLNLHNEIPFKRVYVHGLMRDKKGQKMSKSRGNGLDPLDLIDGASLDNLVAKRTANLMQPQLMKKIESDTRREFPEGIPAFGTDALRFTFCALASTGRDIPFDMNRIAGYQHFCNKLWHSANFVLSQTEGLASGYPIEKSPEAFSNIDHWILESFADSLTEVHEAFSNYRFDKLANLLYSFTWHEYCDWYLELSKITLVDKMAPEDRKTAVRYRLLQVLEALVRALHPVIPFITERIWQRLVPLMHLDEGTIMLQDYPQPDQYRHPSRAVRELSNQQVGWLKRLVTQVRTMRAELNVSPAKPIDVLLQQGNEEDRALSRGLAPYAQKLAQIARLDWLSDDARPPPASVQIVGDMKILIPLAGLIEKDSEIERLGKEIDNQNQLLDRIRKQLANPDFTDKAPVEVVREKRSKEGNLRKTINKLRSQMVELKKL